MADQIKILAPDPAWPGAFAAERAKIESLLKRDDLLFEHVGSTAVPGLCAKPTIDIMIGSKDGAVDDAAKAAFEKLGYGYLGELGVPGRQLFRKGLPPSHHVHWCTTGQRFWRDQLLFRNHLRTHPADAAAYEVLKKGLAARFEHDRQSYTASKNDFITALIGRARFLRGGSRIVFDLEATCWEQGTVVEKQEIIEIGAVELDKTLRPTREFSLLVRPTREPKLSAFCEKLTGIRQADVDGAVAFPEALEKFVAWAGTGNFELCSWGEYDLEQLKVECRRMGRDLPAGFERHVDLREHFARVRREGPSSTDQALSELGIAREGGRHRALPDARHIAKLAQRLLA